LTKKNAKLPLEHRQSIQEAPLIKNFLSADQLIKSSDVNEPLKWANLHPITRLKARQHGI
jgi:hypothetical protein